MFHQGRNSNKLPLGDNKDYSTLPYLIVIITKKDIVCKLELQKIDKYKICAMVFIE
uniref:Uncharacterized protein n=1 Tax=Anguilla anguilla TaxID=7936 RepID=A0A0E9SWN6_ANGAN